MNTFKERLKRIREHLKLTQKDMSSIMGVSLKVYQRYEKGEQKPSYEKLIPLINTFNVNINWLLTGKGEMFIKQEKTKEDLTIEEQIIETIADEPIQKKKALLEFLKNFWTSKTQSTSEEGFSTHSSQKTQKNKIF